MDAPDTRGGKRRLAAGLAVVLVLEVAFLVVLLPAMAGPAAAQDNVTNVTGYYNNTSTAVDNATYYDGRKNATLDNTINMLTRLGTYVIGVDDSETALSGGATLLIGFVVWGAVLSMSSWSRTGMVGGGVLGTATVGGLVTLGLAPDWLWAAVLFVLAVLLSGPILRAVD